MSRPRLAVIGCGRVSERFHLPVTYLSDEFELSALVDRDVERARSLADTYQVPNVFEDSRELPGSIDAAIVATPHHLHVKIASELVRRGVHVLVEKPMALDVTGCNAMIDASHGKAVLAVGLVRRFYESSLFIKELLQANLLGSVRRIDVREGVVFNWQVATDATFRKDMGGGVLFDIGTHVLDLLLWWIGDFEHVRYADDAMGGVEADCELHLTFKSGAHGTVELSRTRFLRNTIVIEGERATVEVGPACDAPVALTVDGQSRRLTGPVVSHHSRPDQRLEDVFARQLTDFAEAIKSSRGPLVSGVEGRRAIALLETCRSMRQPLELPWLSPQQTFAAHKGER